MRRCEPCIKAGTITAVNGNTCRIYAAAIGIACENGDCFVARRAIYVRNGGAGRSVCSTISKQPVIIHACTGAQMGQVESYTIGIQGVMNRIS